MTLTARFSEALTLAHHLHGGQVRKGTAVPYVAHVLAVAGIALEHGADEDEAIAALLHDAVEDCGGAPVLADIRHRFGDRVADIVSACSDTDVTPKPPWQARKEAYLAHLKDAPASVRLVSAADKLHNARTILADYRNALVLPRPGGSFRSARRQPIGGRPGAHCRGDRATCSAVCASGN
ncbi:MAG: HD domain-containing protein [Rhodocyclales bacterium]|nr:HD domain-containing protein [Rhodocyclales bacterium]